LRRPRTSLRLVAVEALVNPVDVGVSGEFREFETIGERGRDRFAERNARRFEVNGSNGQQSLRPKLRATVCGEHRLQSVLRARDRLLRRIDALLEVLDLRLRFEHVNGREHAALNLSSVGLGLRARLLHGVNLDLQVAERVGQLPVSLLDVRDDFGRPASELRVG
jgi:hypothetical protein